jgi:G3E family GTPase
MLLSSRSDRMIHMSERVATTIITGFLGSGKTTIIGHLIDFLQSQGKQVIYLKNEIGDEDIDGQLMKTKQVVARELLNGCICCTLVGPFISAINEVIETYHPDRIIIEASGAADPAALALMVSSHPLLLREAVVSIIDVLNFEGYQELTTTAQAQTRLTDIIVFNKVELADRARKEAVVGYVRELNTHSPILEAPHGQISPDLIFGATTRELDTLLLTEPHHHHDHVTEDELQSFRCERTTTIEVQKVLSWLETLPAQIFRVKGVVTDETGQQWLINRVASRTTSQRIQMPTHMAPASLIFIGHQIHQLEEEITNQWQGL